MKATRSRCHDRRNLFEQQALGLLQSFAALDSGTRRRDPHNVIFRIQSGDARRSPRAFGGSMFAPKLEFHEHHHYSFNHDGFTATAGSSGAEADTAAQ